MRRREHLFDLQFIVYHLAPCARAVHQCAIRFPDVAGSVVHLLMDFLGDTNSASAFDVAMFVRAGPYTGPPLSSP